MARYFLSIQKKFLLLILLVGLAPTALALLVIALGSQVIYARAMAGALESRASKVAAQLGRFGEEIDLEMRRLMAVSGGQFPRGGGPIGRPRVPFAAFVRYQPGQRLDIRGVGLEETELGERLAAKEAYFASLTEGTGAPPGSYIDDLWIEGRGEHAPVRLICFSYPEPESSGRVFFLAPVDDLLRRVVAEQGAENEPILIYSGRGYLLTSAATPAGLAERAQALFSAGLEAVPGRFHLRSWAGGVRTWHIVGYAVIPRLLRLAADGNASAPWVVLSVHDMENFLAFQSRLVWITVIGSLAWTAALMALSVVAARRVVGPVKALRSQAEAMAGGDLNARARVRTGDEIQDLAEAFNIMAERLRESRRDLERRLEENRLRAEQINVINEITRAISQALDLDRIFEVLRRQMKNTLHYDGMWIALAHKTTGKLEVTHAEPPELLKALRRGEAPLEFSFHGRVMREARPDRGAIGPADDSDVFESGVYLRLGFESYLVAPLPSVGRVQGTLTVVSSRADAYGPEETEILASIASAVAIGIEQAELFQQARRFAEELERKVEERTRDLASAQQKLIQTEKYAATGRLAANLAHEINNPLGIIKNYLRLASDQLGRAGGGRRVTDPNLQHLSIINEEIDRIARIVRQLLDLHRPPEQTTDETDIGALLSDIVALMEDDLARDGIRVHCEFQPDLPRLVVAPDLIRQVFINLIRNAQDAMPGGGEMTLRARLRDQFEAGRYRRVIAVSVADTGHGIPPEHLSHIFDPFFTTKPPEQGTGLGLSVSFGIVRMYQGSIDVQSEPGRGTTMTVTLPLEAEPAEPAREVAEPAQAGATLS